MFSPFYHQLIRKYTIAFGSLWNNLTLLRYDSSGAEAQRFTVPIEYSPRESFLSRLHQDPNLTKNENIRLPRLAYEMTGLYYDKDRRLNALNQRLSSSYTSGADTVKRYFVGVPYIMAFNLYAITRNIEDANEIVEQIIPFITPDYTLTVKLIPSVGILDKMRIVLDDKSPLWSDSYQKGFETTREILLTFGFKSQVTLYGPVADTPANIIRKVIVDLYDASTSDQLVGPMYYLANGVDKVLLENGSGRLIDESSVTDLLDLARIARIEVVPHPVDAAPTKPVDTTTTVTEYVDGKVVNVFTGVDTEIGA